MFVAAKRVLQLSPPSSDCMRPLGVPAMIRDGAVGSTARRNARSVRSRVPGLPVNGTDQLAPALRLR
jgi:hypothetical protein